jgi:hypothetical protein
MEQGARGSKEQGEMEDRRARRQVVDQGGRTEGEPWEQGKQGEQG